MARKRIIYYAVFHDVDATSEIHVFYEGGGRDVITTLSIGEARYILDILRNEKPMDYDAEIRRFFSGAHEPVGEAE